MCLDDTFVQYVHAMAMHNYEMRHGDLINSHNTRVQSFQDAYTRANARVVHKTMPDMRISGRWYFSEQICCCHEII